MKEIPFNLLLDYRSLDQLSRMNDTDRADLLTEILRQPPSKTLWNAIWELFATWPSGEIKSRHLEFTLQALATWPDELRFMYSSNSLLYDGNRLSMLARMVRSIEVHRREESGTAELLAIASSEYSAELKYLSIDRSEIDSQAWQALVQSSYLSNLRHLHIRKTMLGASDIQRLLQSSRLLRLQCLKLIDVGLQPRRMGSMLNATPVPGLCAIDLSSNGLGDVGLTILSQAGWLMQIERFAVRHNYIGVTGMRTLFLSQFCERMQEIDAADNRLTDSEKNELLALAGRKNIKLKLL
jgi:hypothetical protein